MKIKEMVYRKIYLTMESESAKLWSSNMEIVLYSGRSFKQMHRKRYTTTGSAPSVVFLQQTVHKYNKEMEKTHCAYNRTNSRTNGPYNRLKSNEAGKSIEAIQKQKYTISPVQLR